MLRRARVRACGHAPGSHLRSKWAILPIVLVWDNLNTHVSRAMRERVASRDWLTVFQLPPYASELNPVERIWSVLKRSLANLAKHDITQLTALVKTRSGGCNTGPACSPACSSAPGSISRLFSNIHN